MKKRQDLKEKEALDNNFQDQEEVSDTATTEVQHKNEEPSKRFVTEIQDKNVQGSKTLSTEIQDKNEEASKTVVTESQDINEQISKTLATEIQDKNEHVSKKLIADVQNKNEQASKTVASEIQNKNEQTPKTISTVIQNKNQQTPKTLTTEIQDKNEQASKIAVTEDEQNSEQAFKKKKEKRVILDLSFIPFEDAYWIKTELDKALRDYFELSPRIDAHHVLERLKILSPSREPITPIEIEPQRLPRLKQAKQRKVNLVDASTETDHPVFEQLCRGVKFLKYDKSQCMKFQITTQNRVTVLEYLALNPYMSVIDVIVKMLKYINTINERRFREEYDIDNPIYL